MRLTFIYSLILLVFVSCDMEPNVPVVKPYDFNKEEYTESMKRFNEGLLEKPKPVEEAVADTEIDNPTADSLGIAADIPARRESGREKTDTIKLKVSYGKATHEGNKQAGDKLLFEFDSDTAKKLFLKVIPAIDSANLRISEYTDPEGNSTGPFGRTAEIPVEIPGLQKVLVSESLMQGDSYSGNYFFEVRLGW